VDHPSALVLRASPALVATVAWEVGDGTVTSVNVWDNPSAVADLFDERIQPLIEADGAPDYRPVRHGSAVATYFRGQAPKDDSIQPTTRANTTVRRAGVMQQMDRSSDFRSLIKRTQLPEGRS
jgi:hypothetical protein